MARREADGNRPSMKSFCGRPTSRQRSPGHDGHIIGASRAMSQRYRAAPTVKSGTKEKLVKGDSF